MISAQGILICKKILEHFPNEMNLEIMKPAIDPSFVSWICNQVQRIMQQEPNVIDTTSSVHIVGDIHGQFTDLATIFKLGKTPLKQRYIFLGDYIDRGENSLEVICLLFILKYSYPKNMILLRGNHESRGMAYTYGFSEECEKKLNSECIKYFCDTFDKMPLCAVVDKKAFCIHGGISKDLHSIQDILDIKRFGEIPDKGLFCDLVWSDPSKDCKEWEKSERCETNIWGLEPALKFLEDNHLSIIIRGHQVVKDGYQYDFYPDKAVVTVFSSTDPSSKDKNRAVFMTINKESHKFTEIRRPVPLLIPTGTIFSSTRKVSPERKSLSAISTVSKNNNNIN